MLVQGLGLDHARVARLEAVVVVVGEGLVEGVAEGVDAVVVAVEGVEVSLYISLLFCVCKAY